MRFYTLSPSGGDANDNTLPQIRVVRVTLPGEIDRPELVQRIDANRVHLAEQDRWAGPLGEMIRRTLSADLQARLPAAGGQGMPGSPESLSVEIEDFIGDADCAVALRAAWSLTRATPDQPPLQGYETVRVAAPSSCQVSVLPEVMSRALAELSARIVAARGK